MSLDRVVSPRNSVPQGLNHHVAGSEYLMGNRVAEAKAKAVRSAAGKSVIGHQNSAQKQQKRRQIDHDNVLSLMTKAPHAGKQPATLN